MDTQIWYTIFSTLLGGIYGAFQRLGEVLFLLTFFYIPWKNIFRFIYGRNYLANIGSNNTSICFNEDY
jgi:hypothetical protein